MVDGPNSVDDVFGGQGVGCYYRRRGPTVWMMNLEGKTWAVVILAEPVSHLLSVLHSSYRDEAEE